MTGMLLALLGETGRPVTEEEKTLNAKPLLAALLLPFALTIIFSLLASLLVAITIVPTAHEVEEIIFGKSGLAEALPDGYTIIDMSTSYPPDTRRIAERVLAKGGRFLDAPVTGGPPGTGVTMPA